MTGDIVVDLRWNGRERFAIEVGAHRFQVDGESSAGASPMQHMAVAIGSCMAIDVAHILGKMRTPPQSLDVRLAGERVAEPPRRFTRIVIDVRVQGDVPESNLERALELSRDKYCSAWATVRQDVELQVRSSVSPPPDA